MMPRHFGWLYRFHIRNREEVVVGIGFAVWHKDHWHGPIVSKVNSCEELEDGEYIMTPIDPRPFPTTWDDKVIH
jgi:hypothetical protein